jgi:outer membrane beta-barrel protein
MKIRNGFLNAQALSLTLATLLLAGAIEAIDSSPNAFLVSTAMADGGEAVATDDYSFEWLDPDKKIYVLQNRKYTKANRVMLSINGGLASTSPYQRSYSVDPRLAFYFSEQLGIEVFYTTMMNSPSSDYAALVSTNSTVLPNIYRVKNQVGGLLQWVPWYAKINFFNSIIYFDWYVSAGVGQLSGEIYQGGFSTTPVTKSFTGYYLGTGHLFHLSQSFTMRLDFTNVWFNAPLRYTAGEKTWFTNNTFQVGLGLRL